ncbi:MAG TPA: hypothetical protein ENJ27_00730 [Candidatus Moranbacteria bacterium]|nr:hypothetical protein [Candidatus Moranbacteria bacterium]
MWANVKQRVVEGLIEAQSRKPCLCDDRTDRTLGAVIQQNDRQLLHLDKGYHSVQSDLAEITLCDEHNTCHPCDVAFSLEDKPKTVALGAREDETVLGSEITLLAYSDTVNEKALFTLIADFAFWHNASSSSQSSS